MLQCGLNDVIIQERKLHLDLIYPKRNVIVEHNYYVPEVGSSKNIKLGILSSCKATHNLLF